MPNYFSAPTSDWHGREAQSDKRRNGQSKSFGAAPEKHQDGARLPTFARLSTRTKAYPPFNKTRKSVQQKLKNFVQLNPEKSGIGGGMATGPQMAPDLDQSRLRVSARKGY